MSVEAIACVLHHSRATGTAKVVLIGIANHAGDGGSWPTIETLSKYAGVNERNVQVAIRKLEELGEILVHLQAGGTRQTQDRYRSNRYEILVSCPANCDRSTSHRCPIDEPQDTAEQTSVRGVDSDTPHAQTGVMDSTPLTPVRGVESDASGVSLSTPEPSYNHPDTPQPPASGGPKSPTSCIRHPDAPGPNCRACGTTNRDLAEQRQRDAAAVARAAEQQRIADERRLHEQTAVPSSDPAAQALLEQTRRQLAGTR